MHQRALSGKYDCPSSAAARSIENGGKPVNSDSLQFQEMPKVWRLLTLRLVY